MPQEFEPGVHGLPTTGLRGGRAVQLYLGSGRVPQPVLGAGIHGGILRNHIRKLCMHMVLFLKNLD